MGIRVGRNRKKTPHNDPVALAENRCWPVPAATGSGGGEAVDPLAETWVGLFHPGRWRWSAYFI
jgi:hypothetical protein